MTIRVLIVDDSSFFRHRLREVIDKSPDMETAGEAGDGLEAVQLAEQLKPDVITMDVEMPNLNGIDAVRRIMAQQPIPILMISNLTWEGAQATLDALQAGATDFMPKHFDDLLGRSDNLLSRIRGIMQRHSSYAPKSAAPIEAPPPPAPRRKSGRIRLVTLATSTGGPVALQQILTALPGDFPLPIVLVQHMPADFTAPFAERLNNLCRIRVRQAEDGEALEPGLALLAPGGCQMTLKKAQTFGKVSIREAHPDETYRPCVDISFHSIAESFGAESLYVVLTGMGSDGCEGARSLKAAGARVWSQDADSSVVYGMPMVVAKAGLSDRVLPLSGMADALIQAV